MFVQRRSSFLKVDHGAPPAVLAYSLDAAAGTYAITGNANANIFKDYFLNTTIGAYTLTGNNNALIQKDSPLNLTPGTYAITGAQAALLKASLLGGAAGSYAITGNANTNILEIGRAHV